MQNPKLRTNHRVQHISSQCNRSDLTRLAKIGSFFAQSKISRPRLRLSWCSPKQMSMVWKRKREVIDRCEKNSQIRRWYVGPRFREVLVGMLGLKGGSTIKVTSTLRLPLSCRTHFFATRLTPRQPIQRGS